LLTNDDEVEDDVTDRAVINAGWRDKEVDDQLTAEATIMEPEALEPHVLRRDEP
jgi:hypothetical protein